MTPAQRADVERGIHELMVVGEIIMALGRGNRAVAGIHLEWLGGQVHRIVHIVSSDLGDIEPSETDGEAP